MDLILITDNKKPENLKMAWFRVLKKYSRLYPDIKTSSLVSVCFPLVYRAKVFDYETGEFTESWCVPYLAFEKKPGLLELRWGRHILYAVEGRSTNETVPCA